MADIRFRKFNYSNDNWYVNINIIIYTLIMEPTKIKITNCHAVGNSFKNLIPESEHTIIDPPEQYKTKYPNGPKFGYWVMGVDEPVRVLPEECKTI